MLFKGLALIFSPPGTQNYVPIHLQTSFESSQCALKQGVQNLAILI